LPHWMNPFGKTAGKNNDEPKRAQRMEKEGIME
jgi:hypothetical protein